MQDQQILNSTITIESIEQKDNRVSILAHDKNRYSFWATRKAKDDDGNPVLDTSGQPVLEESSPMGQFRNMGLRKGSTVRIGYVIEFYTDKMGKQRESKKIINFQETNDQPTQTSQTTIPGRTEAPIASQGHSSGAGGRNFDQEGYEKCAWTYFVDVCNGDLDSFGKALQDSVVHDAFQAIKADSRKHFSPLRQAVERHAPKVVLPEEELPTIQVEDIDVEGIPF